MTGMLPLLKACPFCAKELVVMDGANPIARCGTPGCWMNARRLGIVMDDPAQVKGWNERPMEDGLALCLARAIDTPLLTLPDPESGGTFKINLRLYSFLPEVADEAAELLEEIGR